MSTAKSDPDLPRPGPQGSPPAQETTPDAVAAPGQPDHDETPAPDDEAAAEQEGVTAEAPGAEDEMMPVPPSLSLARIWHIGDEVLADHPEWLPAVKREPLPEHDLSGLPDISEAYRNCRPFLWAFGTDGEPTEPLAPFTVENTAIWLDRLAPECLVPADYEPWLKEGIVIARQREHDEAPRSHGPMAIATVTDPGPEQQHDTSWLPRVDQADTQAMERFLDLTDAEARR